MDIGFGREGGDAVDDAFMGGGGEAVGRMFGEEGGLLLIGPAGGVVQNPCFRVVFPCADGIGADPAVLALLVCRDGVGVIPEVEAVDILVIKPKPDMVGMVGGVARAGLEW